MIIRNKNGDVFEVNDLVENILSSIFISYGFIPNWIQHENEPWPEFDNVTSGDISRLCWQLVSPLGYRPDTSNDYTSSGVWYEISSEDVTEMIRILDNSILDLEIDVYDEVIEDACMEQWTRHHYIRNFRLLPVIEWEKGWLRQPVIKMCKYFMEFCQQGPLYIFV